MKKNKKNIKSKSFISRKIDKFLNNTHEHFSCYLPKNIGKIAHWFLKIFYSGIKIEKKQTEVIDKLKQDGIIVYASKYKRTFEFLFYYTRYKEEGLPFPEIAFDYNIIMWQPVKRIFQILVSKLSFFSSRFFFITPYKSGYLRNELVLNGKTAFFSLIEKEDFHERFVKSKTGALQHLVQIQKTTDKPIYIIPHLIFFTKKRPKKTFNILQGSSENPNIIRRVISLFKNYKKISVETSEYFDLKKFIEKPEIKNLNSERQASAAEKILIDRINRHRQSVTGPILKSAQEIKQSILTKKSLNDFMEEYCETNNKNIYEVRKKADNYVNEIAATKYSPLLIRIIDFIIKFIISRMFEKVVASNKKIAKIKEMAKRGPLVLIPCHKSHIDYLVFNHVIYHHGIPLPQIAAGKNMAFWPMSYFFRKGGVFFLRRIFKGAALYSKVFSEYIYKILEEGFNVEFFIEGTRSRSGKLLNPKLGFLSILVNSYKEGACNDIIFAPVFIGYDRIVEDRSYIHEIAGAKKKAENFKGFIKARKFLKKRYGKIYIKFNDPVSIKDFLQGTDIKKMSQDEIKELCQTIGVSILNSIDAKTVATPYSIVAASILNSKASIFSNSYILNTVKIYLRYLYYSEAKPSDTLLADENHAINTVIDAYLNRKFIEPVERRKKNRKTAKRYSINESKRAALDYYKNNCIILFIPIAYASLAILNEELFEFTVEDVYNEFKFLEKLFKNDFSPNIKEMPESLVDKSIHFFVTQNIIKPYDTDTGKYGLVSTDLTLIKNYARFLKNFLESYLIVLNYLRKYSKNLHSPKERMKKIEFIGKSMLKRKEIDFPESLSKINYKNALDYFFSNEIRGVKDKEKINFYVKKIKNYIRLIQ
jgi:glycerol-3-phosphate O-acyltransferase